MLPMTSQSSLAGIASRLEQFTTARHSRILQVFDLHPGRRYAVGFVPTVTPFADKVRPEIVTKLFSPAEPYGTLPVFSFCRPLCRSWRGTGLHRMQPQCYQANSSCERRPSQSIPSEDFVGRRWATGARLVTT